MSSSGEFSFLLPTQNSVENSEIPPEILLPIQNFMMSFSRDSLEKFKIPLEEILLATQDFSSERHIARDGYVDSYRGQLENRTVAVDLHCWGYQGAFEFPLMLNSTFQHKNILPFIGYSRKGHEDIAVFEYAVNGSLDEHLREADKMRSLTWADRLKICLGAATGLGYLHSGLGEDRIIIHRNVKSENILLDDNLEAKICDLRKSILLDRNQPQAFDPIEGALMYMDPIYEQTGIANTESDVYSFGVVLFEMLSGGLAVRRKSIDGDKPQRLINLVRRHYDYGLYNLIDPAIRDQMSMRSFKVFKETAYQCLSWNLKARPTMDRIIKSLTEALDFQSLQYENLERFRIPLLEINLATEHLGRNCFRGYDSDGTSGWFRGQLSEQWHNRTAEFKCYGHANERRKDEFVKELEMMSNFNHKNIINLIGFCDEGKNLIIVYEANSDDSLAYNLKNPNESSGLTWAERMNICVGAARALEYLHSGIGDNKAVIHADVTSGNIFLDDNVGFKIGGFKSSLLVDQNQKQIYQEPNDIPSYMDPIYIESGVVNTGTDVYSFGVVLFEVLCGMLADDTRSIDDGQPHKLLNLVHRYYDDGLEKIMDPNIKDQINSHSLYTFKKIAYRCISTNSSDRPTMKRVLKRFEETLKYQDQGAAYNITTRSLDSYQIPINEIILATRNFDRETSIGEGGFGVVYKGNLSQSWQNCTVAIKRLNPKGHQGKKEFHAELNLISRFHHPNIIHFVGYCDEQDQMIIVYQYAANKSLDYYLVDRTKMRSLTWAQHLNICLGAAKGLDYLHSGLGKHHRVIHRDVKSRNILLDENLEAKICDFGLSTEVPGTQESSQILTKVAGTNFYMDPIYYGSGVLRKESDIYSFGVVLFEILSGRPAYCQIDFVDGIPQHLINLVRRYYENGPENLVDPDLRDHIDSRSFVTFKEIAYQCISFISAERPTMDTIIDKIEDAIDFQLSAII